MSTVGVAIPSIPPRQKYLCRAIKSVLEQTVPVTQISVAVDHYREGAGPTRNKAKNAVKAEWTLFLDDDDELLPHHTEHLMAVQQEHDADVVFPWFKVIGGHDPFPGHRGLSITWDHNQPSIFPITVLIRTETAQSLDFDAPDPHLGVAGEDWTYWKALGAAGAKIIHTPEITWHWRHDSGNTAGRNDRW